MTLSTRHRFINLCLVALSAAILAFAGCGQPKYIDPPLLTYPTDTMARLSAEAHAKDIGGKVFHVADTHSMEPALQGGDYIVVAPKSLRSFDSVLAWEMGVYAAEWYKPHPVTHRFALKDGLGWIMSGDNNARSEPHWRVTDQNFIGVVVGRYRVKP